VGCLTIKSLRPINYGKSHTVGCEELGRFQGKISKSDTQIEQPRKWNVTVGPEAAVSPFQSPYEWVRAVHGFNKNHGHPCRPLTNDYVPACAERRIVLAGKKSLSTKVW
jgi:hypothetical protein